MAPSCRCIAKKGGGDSWEHIKKGFEEVRAMDWNDAHKRVKHPVSCIDCHEPKNAQLRITCHAFTSGIATLPCQLGLFMPLLPRGLTALSA
jgi:nitrite reductase (cytochrome c-552)